MTILIGSAIFFTAEAATPNVSFSTLYPYQGDAVLVGIDQGGAKPLSVDFGGNDFPVFSQGDKYVSLVAVRATETPGWDPVKVVFSGDQTVTKWIYVVKKQFPLIVMSIPKSIGLTSGEIVDNIQTQTEDLGKILDKVTPAVFFKGSFGLPLVDNSEVTTEFGEIMKIGESEVRHLGVDLAAKKGSVIGAMNGGVVRYAGLDGTYGNMVVVDHGEGIYSMYLHLSKIAVKVGAAVKKGQLIGLVGDTGYATGPHLHLSVKIDGISVDPLSFVGIFK